MNIVIDYLRHGEYFYILAATYRHEDNSTVYRMYYCNHNLNNFHLIRSGISFNGENTQNLYRDFMDRPVEEYYPIGDPFWGIHVYPWIAGYVNRYNRYGIYGSLNLYETLAGDIVVERIR